MTYRIITQILISIFMVFLNSPAIQNTEFEVQRGNQKLKLELENERQYLKWNEKTILTLKFENIDSRNLALSAPGLQRSGSQNTEKEGKWEITPNRKFIKSDTLKLSVRVRNLKDSVWTHKFKIPIRE